MRYFAYIAEQAFGTSPDGQRLFYRGRPWSRAYVIPDAATEKRLFTKQLWMMRILLGAMILGQPFLFAVVPDVTSKPLWFVAYMALVLVIFWIFGHLVFRSELRALSRATVRLPLRSYYTSMAARHSTTQLLLGLLGSIVFVVAGIGILAVGYNGVHRFGGH